MKRAARAATPTVFEKLEERRMLALTPVGGEFQAPVDTNNHQRFPAVAMDADGDFVIGWTATYFTGATYEAEDVVIRRYQKDGTPLGNDFVVNTFTAGTQDDVAVAMSDGGSFVVVWTSWGQDEPFDENNPGALRKGIYAQRFNADGSVAGAEFRVNSFTTGDQFDPAVAMDAQGNFVVSWTSEGQEGGTDTGIYARKYNSAGAAFATEFLVNTITGEDQQASSVASDSDGNFVVSWESYSTDFGIFYDIYARRFDIGTAPLDTTEFQVNTDSDGFQINSAVAMDASGNFVVTFEDYSLGDIYVRRYSADGVAQGPDTVANLDNGIESEPAVAMDAQGNFVITWVGPDGSATGILGQHFNSSGVKLGPELALNSGGGTVQANPAVAMADAGNVVFVWTSDGQDVGAGGETGVYGRLFEQQTPPPWPNDQETQIHTFTTGAQINPAIGVGANGDIVVVWQSFEQDGSGWGIFGQRYSGLGIAKGLEFSVNTTFTGDQTRPVVAVNPSGGFVVLWESADIDQSGIFGRVFDSNGLAATGEVQINTVEIGDQLRPDLAMDGDGNFVAAWQSDGVDAAGSAIVMRRFGANGVSTAGETQVNTFTTGSQITPAIAMSPDGDFAIVWTSPDQPEDVGLGIWGQRYKANLTPVGDEFKVNSYTVGDQLDPDIGMDVNGNFVVVWQSIGQVAGTLRSIHFQRYDEIGEVAGGEVHVDGGATINGGGSSPVVSMDGTGNFVVVWQENDDPGADNDGGAGILAQRYNGDGSPRNSVLRINANTPGNQVTPAIATNPIGDVAIVWTDETGDSTLDEGIFGRRLEHLTSNVVAGGAEFPINTFTPGNQFNTVVSTNENGESIVVWQSFNQVNEDGIQIDNSDGIFAQRYDSAGNRVGTEFHVNTYTPGAQSNPSVAWGPDGTFIFVWHTAGFSTGGSLDVVARRYSSEGEALGTEFRVNSYTTDVQLDASVAVDDEGDFAIVWRSFRQASLTSGYDVYARRYNAAGEALDVEFPVNAYTTNNQNIPAIGMDDAGNFVITWASFNAASETSHFDIFARYFDSDGLSSTASEFLVNTFTTNAQTNPQIAMQPTGEFIIVWESLDQLANGPVVFSNLDVFAQRFANTRTAGIPDKVGLEFQVNSYTVGPQSVPVVAVDDTGDFVIAWASYLQDGEVNGIYAKRYDSTGTDVEGEFQVNIWTTASQFQPTVAMDPDGKIFVAWQSTGGQDGNLAGVFGRRFQPAAINPVVLGRSFIWQNSPQRIVFQVDRDVSASVNPGPSQTAVVILENLTTQTTYTDFTLLFNPVSKAIEVRMNSRLDGSSPAISIPGLPNGRYRATLVGTSVTDGAGNNLGVDQVLEFFFVNGDANHDAYVDVRDLYLLSQKWLQASSGNYAQGDFNYDGLVDQTDLTILARYWGTTPANIEPPPVPAAPIPAPTSPAPAPEPTPAPAPEPTPEPTPQPPRRTPIRTPIRNVEIVSTPTTTAPATPAVATPSNDAPAPAPASAPVVAETPAPAPVIASAASTESEPAPTSAVVETPAQAAPTAVVEQAPPPAPVVQQQTPPPAPAPVVASPAPQESAPVAQQPAAPTSPFASTPVLAEAPNQAPPKRTASRTPLRAAALVDL